MPRVLIVDDEILLRRCMSRCLISRGFDVMEAAGGAEGLERYRACRPDLVISDIVMGDLDGLSMIEAIRAHDPDVRVVFVTGSIDETLAAGQPVLHKPFGCDELTDTVLAALREAA
jgi:CheY-like chemotaxis protein